ncbi:MAG TPA: heat-inducible transcriptional repressor HrcA [Bacillota bacterium]|nr:heat-inducible transcriptional repressor HrcA [Bacillota bacterium]HPE38863.1 heat-inducible transcriptional repressor HrcA [Bacillota bacterium]
MALDERKRKILQAIVDDYVATAEPVGSKSLIEHHNFSVSSATLRNEMAELEQLGYLEQPHTSAGRIPSDKGYREYVDSLMHVDVLSEKESEEIKHQLDNSFHEIATLLKAASNTLSEQTGYVSLALTPRFNSSYLTQLKMMMIEPGKALVVVVLSAGVVKDRLVRIPDFLTPEQVQAISQSVEEGLCGKPLSEITLVTVATAAKQNRAKLPDALLNQILYEAYTAIKQADNLDIYMEGTHRMLSLPEFHDVDRARGLFDTLSRDGIVAGYVNEVAKKETKSSYMIRIGQEITLDGLDDCSFITTTYSVGNQVAGNIGVIGPKRMEYSKVISQIDFVRSMIDQQLKET